MRLLKLGKHFRVQGRKIIVGRNKEENQSLLSLANRFKITYLDVTEHKGPITLLVGEEDDNIIKIASAITARYSDAPKEAKANVRCIIRMTETKFIEIQAATDKEITKWRV